MEQTALLTTVMVTLSGSRISQHTIREALETVGVSNVEVTWSAVPPRSDDGRWRITVATGHKVTVGALPAHRQNARDLARYLGVLLQRPH